MGEPWAKKIAGIAVAVWPVVGGVVIGFGLDAARAHPVAPAATSSSSALRRDSTIALEA